jgi:hypothetical protein
MPGRSLTNYALSHPPMEKWGGIAGKLLKVDLYEKKIETENLDSEIVRNFIGGTG